MTPEAVSSPLQPYLPGPYVLRNERMPVGGVDVADTEDDEQQHHRHFDGDDDGVEARGLADSDITDDRQTPR